MGLTAGAAFPAAGQHLNFAASHPWPTQATLLAAAAAPERFAAYSETPKLFAVASTPAPVDFSTDGAAAYESSSEALPESPSATLPDSRALDAPGSGASGQFSTLDAKTAPRAPDNRPIAPQYTKYIPPGWAYQPIHGRDKFILGARDLYSAANILGFFASSGFSQLTNGQPNYGTDKGAFGQRLGAAAIRNTAQGIFTDGVFAVMFHQDPRYFGKGRQYSVIHRALYAATRPIIVRTTNGTGSTVNSSLLAGYAAAALLNNAYYPSINRNVKDTFTSYGGSIGGAALGFVVSEFTDDVLRTFHLRSRP